MSWHNDIRYIVVALEYWWFHFETSRCQHYGVTEPLREKNLGIGWLLFCTNRCRKRSSYPELQRQFSVWQGLHVYTHLNFVNDKCLQFLHTCVSCCHCLTNLGHLMNQTSFVPRPSYHPVCKSGGGRLQSNEGNMNNAENSLLQVMIRSCGGGLRTR